MTEQKKLLRKIRTWLVAFIVLLILSGITAFPLQWELSLVNDFMMSFPSGNEISRWYFRIFEGVNETWNKYPFIAYGTDWLAFSHIVIAVAFIGPLRDPVRNVWVLEFGMIACIMVIPLALVAGEVRGIPFFWRMIDCSFGVFGIIPLYICRKSVKKLEALTKTK